MPVTYVHAEHVFFIHSYNYVWKRKLLVLYGIKSKPVSKAGMQPQEPLRGRFRSGPFLVLYETLVWENTFPSISSLLISEPDVTFLMFFFQSFTLAGADWTEEVDLLGDRACLLEGIHQSGRREEGREGR